ncbi:hypothetical protein V6N12_023818 [Hibiscus sabdariffa]|uniref:ribose-5-phosphate isomerase n=1 Tax=Hibiscus sabdariffa TaxID=183260 RepID=A0ABR2FYS0_9ROSI
MGVFKTIIDTNIGSQGRNKDLALVNKIIQCIFGYESRLTNGNGFLIPPLLLHQPSSPTPHPSSVFTYAPKPINHSPLVQGHPVLSQDELKKLAADKAVDSVKSGMILGLGTGSTAAFVVDKLDEVDPNLDLVKGRGGALLREKMVEAASSSFIVVVDDSKLVSGLGGSAKLRLDGSEKPYVTDNGNYIVDLYFQNPIKDGFGARKEISALEGVVEHGLFLWMATFVIIAGKTGVEIMTKIYHSSLAFALDTKPIHWLDMSCHFLMKKAQASNSETHDMSAGFVSQPGGSEYLLFEKHEDDREEPMWSGGDCFQTRGRIGFRNDCHFRVRSTILPFALDATGTQMFLPGRIFKSRFQETQGFCMATHVEPMNRKVEEIKLQAYGCWNYELPYIFSVSTALVVVQLEEIKVKEYPMLGQTIKGEEKTAIDTVLCCYPTLRG